ncbi:MAG: hypothetical protein GY714_00585, partial [Desulfobacterales bacterium]|nr:hypothetical protein [Desulfobacterales bacterium]
MLELSKIKMPLIFIPNKGQADETVKYYAVGKNYGLYFTPHKLSMQLETKDKKNTALEIDFIDSNKHTKIVGQGKLPGIVNYLKG